MANNEWTITSKKRRRHTSNTPAPRKRTRISTPNGELSRSASGRKSGQSTLTQVEFVKSSSFENENVAPELLLPIAEPSSETVQRPVAVSTEAGGLQRDSTLTQLDFVKSLSAGAGNKDSGLNVGTTLEEPVSTRRPKSRVKRRSLKKQDSTLTQMDFFKNTDTNTTSMFDDDETVLQLHTESKISRPPFQLFDGAGDTVILETVEYMRPPARLKTVKPTAITDVTRQEEPETQDYQPPQPRKNRKIADQQLDHGQHPRRSTRKVSRNTISDRPPLLVQDSTEFNSVGEDLPTLGQLAVGPSTPSRPKDRIPSSQTPESVKLSTTRRSKRRRPLADLSANVLLSPRKFSAKSHELSGRKPDKKSPLHRKICILKVPPRALLPQSSKKDHVKDIWAVPLTSSSQGGSRNQSQPKQSDLREVDNNKSAYDTQKSLPDLDEIFRDPSRLVKRTTPSSNQIQDLPLPTEDMNAILELGELSSDESDLGSPVLNDILYVADLNQRISSPTSKANNDEYRLKPLTHPNVVSHISPVRKDFASITNHGSPIVLSPLPVPRLVPSPMRRISQQNRHSALKNLSSGLTDDTTGTSKRVRITQVPLNDTAEYHKTSSSSSPLLPPAFVSGMQRSVYPASLPHPSQVSTQAPSTQAIFPTTPVHHGSRDAVVERITIEDSSSPQNLRSRAQQILDIEDGPSAHVSYDKDEHSQEEEDTITQTPTQKSRKDLLQHRMTTQSSPVILNATTRSQRDAELEIIALSSSYHTQLAQEHNLTDADPSQPYDTRGKLPQPRVDLDAAPESNDEIPSSSIASSDLLSPSPPRNLKRKYSPIPGFDNETQADFTQGGHVTAAYIHKGREQGWLPKNYTPRPYKAKNWKGKAT
ncbi:hypothetical protein LTR64_003628 [Lithohypha guttulata]|uniref:uncharacterized protein n=1 Tax=Lithohypha guttulata TaxID=1690604 RepID=UPI002DDFE676|nr:hypothetical protein LTR51_000152 [Lithohypha guttulata]